MMSSVRPSLNQSWVGSPLRLSNGSTATAGRLLTASATAAARARQPAIEGGADRFRVAPAGKPERERHRGRRGDRGHPSCRPAAAVASALDHVDVDGVGQVLAATRPSGTKRRSGRLAAPRTTAALAIDGAGLGHGLEPGGDVHPVAEDVAVILDDVAQVQAEAQLQRPTGEAVLDRRSGAQGLAGTGEDREEAVASGLEHPAAMALDAGHDDLAHARRRLS